MTHPDAELLALGRQFENAKALARKLDAERNRLHGVWTNIVKERGLEPGNDIPAQMRVGRECGYHAVSTAFNALHSEAIRVMRLIYRAKATTLEGFAVKLAAVAFDQFDFDLYLKLLGGTDVAERQLIRLCRQMEKATVEQRRAS